MNRIKRFLRLFHNLNPDGKHIFGQTGEEYIRMNLIRSGYNVFSNRILKHPKNNSVYIESDVIVYAGDCIFCIEIKRLKGKIFLSENGIIQERNERFERRYRGYRAKRIKSPMAQSELFTRTLKRRLIKKDSRFRGIRFVPVAAFSEEADISSIHSIEKGIVYFSELSDFIKNRAGIKGNFKWVLEALSSLKGFDKIINKNKFIILGFIENENFKCQDAGGTISIPYAAIERIEIKRGGLFSEYDEVKIIKKNGEIENLCCVDGYILINVFKSKQKHFIRNLEEIIVQSY